MLPVTPSLIPVPPQFPPVPCPPSQSPPVPPPVLPVPPSGPGSLPLRTWRWWRFGLGGCPGGLRPCRGSLGRGRGVLRGGPEGGVAGAAFGGAEAPVGLHFRSDGHFRSALPVFPSRLRIPGVARKVPLSLPSPPRSGIPKFPQNSQVFLIWFYFVFYQNSARLRAFSPPPASLPPRLPRAAGGGPGSAPPPPQRRGGVPKIPPLTPPGVGEGWKKGGRGSGGGAHTEPWSPTPPSMRPPPKIWGGDPQYRGVRAPKPLQFEEGDSLHLRG